ncbi:hypothetical protein F4703DRAFT_1828198 [Phycomyces blakesleeanus]
MRLHVITLGVFCLHTDAFFLFYSFLLVHYYRWFSSAHSWSITGREAGTNQDHCNETWHLKFRLLISHRYPKQ